jgi:hypothetical protein
MPHWSLQQGGWLDMPHAAGRQVRIACARVVVLALVAAASGCASTGNGAPKSSQGTDAGAAGGAAGTAAGRAASSDKPLEPDPGPPQADQETFAGAAGSALGAVGGGVLGAAAGALVSVGCGPLALICLPVMVVVGAAGGGEEGARIGGDLLRSAPAPQVSLPATHEKPKAGTALAEPARIVTHTNVVELGPIRASDFSPAGLLTVDLRSIRPLDDGKRTASLVVNFERATNEGEMSYLAEVDVACGSGALTLNGWYSFDTPNTDGRLVRRSPPSQTVTNERPGPPLDAAIRTICSQESKG